MYFSECRVSFVNTSCARLPRRASDPMYVTERHAACKAVSRWAPHPLKHMYVRADRHAGCSSESAPRQDRHQSAQKPSSSTVAPALAAPTPLQQQAGQFWLPQAGTTQAQLQAAAAAAAAAAPGGDAAALAQSQAVYQQHLRLLLLQTLQFNNCATSDSAASAGVSAAAAWPTVRAPLHPSPTARILTGFVTFLSTSLHRSLNRPDRGCLPIEPDVWDLAACDASHSASDCTSRQPRPPTMDTTH